MDQIAQLPIKQSCENGSAGFTVWFTGLSGAGKSTLAALVAGAMRQRGCLVEVLDGDVIRQHLSRDLGFTREDRDEQIRRITFVSKLLARNGVVVVVSAISPYRGAREAARQELGRFVEVHVDCPLEICQQRDVKGLYAKAISGKISGFTGISDPYEPPLAPELILKTDQECAEESAARVLECVTHLGYL